MPLTRLDNLLSSKTGKYIYVSPDDFNASDSLDNRGNSQLRPFVSIQRAFLEVARFSYVPGVDNDRFDQFTINLSPGTHYVDNRPGDLDAADIPVFNYDSATDTWNDPAIFDLSNPNNILYRFNGKDGGATIPRGTSLLGTDLRRTQVRALYVPDPADKDVPRCALFNVTGACYFWQFTIFDGNPVDGPLSGKVYTQPGSTQLSTPLFSHHKMTNFVFADKQDLGSLYTKISKAFSKYQIAIDDVYTAESGRIQNTWSTLLSYTSNATVVYGGEAYKAIANSTNKRPDLETNYWERLSTISREFDYRIQENRIVGPVADTISLDELIVTEPVSGLLDVTVRTKINHGFFPGQYAAIANTGLNVNLEGVFQIISISATNPKEFVYRVVTTANAVGLIPGASIAPGSNATVQAEVDSVESASPYVFNVSIRSTWGICGIWADGRKATGFKSMVIAQYTGVSLQKDDRAFIRYDEFSNTWNQAPLTDAFATTPYHIKGDAYWKDDWRNFHVKASDDSFIQNVSIFAVGFADHFLMESGGDMSITNSNSNFGNTSMHSKGFKGFAFNLDKGGYITDIIPPQTLDDSAQPIKTNYYPINIQLSKPSTNSNRLYLTGDKANNYLSRPAASINGYRLGARTYINDTKCEKLYVNTTADQTAGETGSTTKSAVVYPQGFKIWSSSLDTLSPADLGVGDFNEDGTPNTAADTLSFNLRQDAANLIDANKIFIQAEAFGYILEKYPYLQTVSYINPNITFESGRYRDARNLILSNRQEIIDYAYNQMLAAFPTFTPPSADKCKRDLGLIVDALAADLYDGGNAHMIEATKTYFDIDGNPLINGVVGEITQSVFAFNRARDWAKKAISNLLGNTSLVPVIALAASGTTITATTSSAHGLKVGQEINIGGATQSEYNVYKTVVLASGLTPTQFQYVVSVAPSVTTATGAFYVSKVTIDPANTVDPAGRYKDAAGLVTKNRQEIIDRAAAQIAIDYPDFYYPGDAATTAVSRYKDAYRLIQQNKQEVIDRAEAEIAVQYPDFYYPGDAQTTATSRYKDAYRLMQQNRQEVIDRAAAEIAVQHPDFYYPGDAQTTATSRYKDAYRLIQLNRASIVSTSYAAIATAYPSFVNPSPTSCQRDIGLFIDAVSLDIAQGGGNKYSRKFISNYFNAAGTSWVTGGLQGEELQSNVAFNKARDKMKKAIANQLAIEDLTVTPGPATYGGGGGTIANTSTGACADIQNAIDTLTLVVTSSVTAGNLTSLPTETNGVIPAGEAKCKRDIGLFVDAVSLDIAQGGGNKYSRKFISNYFNAAGTAWVTAGLQGEEAQSVTAFNMARDMLKKALTNQLYTKDTTITAGPATYNGSGGTIPNNASGNSAACADIQSAVDTLTTLITARVTAGNLTGLPAETNLGNSRYQDARNLIVLNRQEIIDRSAAEIAIQYPDFYYPGDTQTTATSRYKDAYRLIQQNRTSIITTAYAASGGSIVGDTNGDKCKRDIGYFIDAVSLDIAQGGGNKYSRKFIKNYFNSAGTAWVTGGLQGEETQSILAFNSARNEMNKAVANQLAIKDLTVTPGPATYGGGGGTIANNNAGACADVQSAITTLAAIVTTRITAGNLTGLPLETTGTIPAGETKCKRDLGLIVDAVASDLSSGGNSNIISATNQYFTSGTLITNGLQGEISQSVTAFNMARDMIKKAVTNQLYEKDLTISAGPATYGGGGSTIPELPSGNAAACIDVQNSVTTLISIITTALTNGNLSSIPAQTTGTVPAGETKCKRDIGLFIDAVSLDIAQGGGNRYSRKFISNYFNSTGTAWVTAGLQGEEAQSIVAFNMARDMMKKALTNQLYVKDTTITAGPATYGGGGGTIANTSTGACADIQTAVDTLTTLITARVTAGNLTGLTAETTGTVPAGETKCKRDIGYIVDSIQQDLYWGGNEFTVGAVREYFTNTTTFLTNGLAGEIPQSVVAFNAARDMVKKAITNQLYVKNLSISPGPATYVTSGSGISIGATIPNSASGNSATCADVQATVDTLFSIISTTLNAGTLDSLPATGNGDWDCANVRNTIDTLFTILTNALSTSNIFTLPTVNPGPWSTVSESSKCRRDIGYIVEAITADLRLGGNENTINAAESYFTGTGQQALSGTLASNGTITGLVSTANLIVGMAITKTSGAGAFGVNPTILSIDSVTQITVTQTSGTVTAGSISFIANQLDYIERERVETLDAYDYVRNLAISSMRNHNTYVSGTATGNSAVITVPSTSGLVVGMNVRSVTTIPSSTGSQPLLTTNYNDELEEKVDGRIVPKATNYTTSIPSTAYIMKIGDGNNGLAVGQIQLGTKGSRFDSGVLVLANSALGTNTPVKFFFQLEVGFWANAIDPSVDLSVIQDYNYSATNGECSSVVENINTFFVTLNTVINNGIGSVAKKVSALNTGSFAKRATLFTLTDTSSGAAPTDPHHLETGTPVRLVPRAKVGSNVDKRLVRLPRGFDTNTVYYVIAPGRKTDPYDYSNTTRFNGTTSGSYQNLMLASSAENAATGIYIYSSETESINEDVVIDVYQYVLDVAYDLNQYQTKRGDGTTLVTTEPHMFDLPNSSWNFNDTQKFQAIFFKPIGNGGLPTGISTAREYFARYINKSNLPTNCQFEVYDTITEAIQGTTPLTFPVYGGTFYTFSSKKRSPLRFAPEAGASLSYDETKLYVINKNIFAVNDYVKVDDEFFFVTGISSTGSDHLVITRASLGTYPTNHSLGATVVKWNYGNTSTVTTLTETVDLVETILDFTSVTGFVVGDYVKLSNSVDSLVERVKITKIEGTQVIVQRAQLGTVVQQQNGTVTATKLSLAVASPSVTTTTSEAFPRLLSATESGNYAGGTWYISADSSRPNTILERIRREDFSTKDKTPDTWFERLEDTREKEDRVYRLRYVIPNYLKSVRDPLRGFVIKARNDQTRRLLPQKILVKPTGSGAKVAELSIPNQGSAVTGKSPNREYLGYTTAEHGPNFTSKYDPYNPATLSEIDLTQKFRVRITTDSKVTFYVQSAKRKIVNNAEYLELTVFNIGIEEAGYKEKLFTTVKIDTPQGGTGTFVSNIVSLPESNTSNIVTWSGASTGKARVHAYFSYENSNYMILKDITFTSKLVYDANTPTVFNQGSVNATLIEPPNDGRSDDKNYLYVIGGANVYTMTPGDTFQAENGNYTISSVEDTEDFESTFYIYDIDEIRRRINGQQDGIYYLTCLRGDIRPLPTGAGVGENFREYKFSQPVSKLYPEFYKNDPEWYKQLDAAAIDPPATVAAADNYVHGLVTVNESKSSVTKEGILDFVQDPGSKVYTFSGTSAIKAQSGGASAGSEARRISIAGNSQYPTEGRIYVELRRPSIARSGNHTFEYLGFGPGNYSTGLPARQEVVLTDIQDFYAQAKRENGGIVFYTGLNSNGDLYIGNRKINAITGEETFLESAALVESQDQGDTIGNFVTTFDGPVTFNDIVSFLAPLNKGPNQFTSPIYMDVGTIVPTTGFDAAPAIQIKANIASNDDSTLRINPITTRPTGDIIITDNRLQVAVVDFNTRGLQDYSIRTATNNVTPDQTNTISSLTSGISQVVAFGTKYPVRTGDIILRGEQVGLTGSVAWIYGNSFETVTSAYKYQLAGFGSGNNKIRITWALISGTSNRYTNNQVGIKSANYQVKITGTFQNSANSGLTSKVLGAWSILGSTFSDTNTYVDLSLNTSVDVGNYDISVATEPTINISISNVAWKEVGVIGAESIRTKTDDIGDYKVGINTVSRSAHTAYLAGFVESGATDPRANLDVVGTTWISGKTLSTSPNNYLANSTLSARTFINQDHAFLVGGDSVTPANAAVFRISTTNSGRVGINTTNAQLNGSADSSIYNVALAVIGDVTFSGSLRIQTDLAVNGGDITTTATTIDFNILNQSTYVGSVTTTSGITTTTGLNLANYAASINIGTSRTDDQFINIANVSDHANVRIANNTASISSNISKVNIGGAFGNNESNSFVSFDSKMTRVGGDLALSYLRGLGSSLKITVPVGSTVEAFNDATILNLANNASTITFGGQGGNTKIRNALVVDASLSVNGNTILNGGLSSFDFTATRAQLGTTGLALTGQSSAPIDKPVDLVTIVNGNVANATYFVNQIDTPGSGDWGGTAFQTAITNILGPEPNSLPALTGNQYYLPLLNASTYSEGDFLLIDTTVLSGKHPEIVRIPTGGLVRASSAPYYIIVERQPLGTFTPTKTNHPDLTYVRKLNIALDATWVTNNLTTSSTDVKLSEFGGQLTTGDYIILQRNTAGTVGEFVKIASTSTTNSRKLTITDGGSPALTVFEVDSINGNTTIGNSSLANSGNLSIYGSITLQGGCGNGSTTTDRALKFRNELYETVNINTCNGDATFGTQYGTIYAIGAFYGSTAAAHSTTEQVHVYRQDPFSTQSLGPSTTLSAAIVGGTTSPTWDIPVNSISGFSVGDLVVIYNGTTQAEIVKITAAPYTSGTNKYLPTIYNATYPAATYPNGGRGQESTIPQAFASGSSVVKIQKDSRTTTLSVAIPATGRTAVESPNSNSAKIRLKLVNGDLIPPKLDYFYVIRIGTEFFYPDSIDGTKDTVYNVRMPKSYRNSYSVLTDYYGGGKLTIYDDMTITSGALRMLGSDSKTVIFSVANDEGHSGDGAAYDPYSQQLGLYMNGTANIYGKFTVYNQQCQENGVCTPDPTFKVINTDGSVELGTKLTINGVLSKTTSGDSSTVILDIKNLGGAGTTGTVGPKKFTMYQDGSIDAFGITQYFTANGGRRWTYVTQSTTGTGQTQANPLQPNNNYLLNCTSGGNMVLYLPATATTGDTIRFLEITGNLTFNTSLIIRALKVGTTSTAIQGDITGSKANAGSGTPLTAAWDSGELIVQTRNASFGLLYVGGSDAPSGGVTIPTNVQGWWLTEL